MTPAWVSRRLAGGLVIAAGIAALWFAPYVVLTTSYWIDIGKYAMYLAILAATWSLIAGVAGQFSFMHVAIAGLAAYAGAVWSRQLFLTHPDWAQWHWSVLVGTGFGTVCGLLLGLLLQRLRGAYFALFTIAFAEVARLVVVAESQWTEGRNSLNVAPMLPGDIVTFYYVMVALLVGVLVVIYLLLGSRYGLYLRAMREDTDAAAAMGVNVAALKLGIITFTSLLVSFSAAVYSHTGLRLVPENLDLLLMSQVIAFAVIGGMESPLAGATAALLLTFALENLRTITLSSGSMVVMGLLLLAGGAALVVAAVRLRPDPVVLRHSMPWLLAAGLLLAWWLFAPADLAGAGSTAGWLVAVAAISCLAIAGSGGQTMRVSLRRRRPMTLLATAVVLVAVGGRLMTTGAVDTQPGVWRFALFGAILVATLRFAPNGLFVPVLDLFSDRRAHRARSVAFRDTVAASSDGGPT